MKVFTVKFLVRNKRNGKYQRFQTLLCLEIFFRIQNCSYRKNVKPSQKVIAFLDGRIRVDAVRALPTLTKLHGYH